MPSLFQTLEDLPPCQCGCGGKYHVDMDRLDQYATPLLEQMLQEIQRIIEPYAGILGCSAPTADEDAWNSWYEQRDQIYQEFYEPFLKLKTELEKRYNPQSLPDFLYALIKMFEQIKK